VLQKRISQIQTDLVTAQTQVQEASDKLEETNKQLATVSSHVHYYTFFITRLLQVPKKAAVGSRLRPRLLCRTLRATNHRQRPACRQCEQLQTGWRLLANTLELLTACSCTAPASILSTLYTMRPLRGKCYQQNRKYLRIALSSERDRTAATGYMYRKFPEVWTCGF